MDAADEADLRVGVVSADPLLRGALAAALAAVDGVDALPLGDAEEGDQAGVHVVLVDLGPGAGGAVASGAVPVLAMASEAAAGGRALGAGASGAVGRTADAEALVPALAATAAGLLVLDPAWRTLLAAPAPSSSDSPLSPREQEVLELLAEGLSNKEIGARLFVSANTVRFHVRAILEKLGAASRTEAVVLGARSGLLEL
jgi:two-component system nitrate/nitrite response regulator NarL